MNISIVIPNYNGEHLLQQNLPKVLDAVKSYKDGTVEIIIADDPSTDNSKEVIADFIAKITDKHITGKTIENRNRKEAGFSKNVNRGVNIATGDILILLNSDVIPRQGFLEPLLSHFSDETIFAVGCMDESVEGEQTILRGRGVGKWQRGFLMHNRGEVDKSNTLWVSGGSGAFRKSTWDKLHGLDTLYNPFYWEDIDLSYRALKAGYKLVFESHSVVVHNHAEGVIKSRFKQSEIKKIVYRNQFIFVWKNITQRRYIVSHMCWLPYHLIKALQRKDKEMISGFFSALISLPAILSSRNKAKLLFVLSDKDVIQSASE